MPSNFKESKQKFSNLLYIRWFKLLDLRAIWLLLGSLICFAAAQHDFGHPKQTAGVFLAHLKSLSLEILVERMSNK